MILKSQNCARGSRVSTIFVFLNFLQKKTKVVMAGQRVAERFDQYRVRCWVPNCRADLLQPRQLMTDTVEKVENEPMAKFRDTTVDPCSR
jgi:hypothetical protein